MPILRLHDSFWTNPPRRRVAVTSDLREIWGADYAPNSAEAAEIKRITHGWIIGAGLQITPAQFDELQKVFQSVSRAQQEQGVAEKGAASPNAVRPSSLDVGV